MISDKHTTPTAPPTTFAEASEQLAHAQQVIERLQAQVELLSHKLDSDNAGLASDSSTQVAAALRASEARFHHMVANVPGMVYQFVLSPEGAVSFPYVSDACRAIYGLEPEAIVANAALIVDAVHPDDSANFNATIAHSAATLTPWEWEGRVLVATGGEKWLHGISRPTRADDGTIVWDGLLLDISDRKLAEYERDQMFAATQVQRQRLDGLLGDLPGIVWEVNTAGAYPQVQFVSAYAEQLLGYPVSDWLSKPDFWSSITHPDDLTAARQGWDTALREKRSTMAQWRWLTRDGRMLWTETQQRPMFDPEGAVIGLRGVTMDISERIEAATQQQRLQEEIIRVQEASLAELSTPLIPISSQVVVMPLIGAIDSRRAQQLVETLLAGLAQQRARTAIIDITGVPVVDTQVANSLLRAAQAVRLLGAQVILTGIRPEVAQTLVGLGVELGGVVTHSTLQRGVAFALDTAPHRH